MWMGAHSWDFCCIEPLRVGNLPISLRYQFQDRDTGVSQEHGISLDETSEIVELLGLLLLD